MSMKLIMYTLGPAKTTGFLWRFCNRDPGIPRKNQGLGMLRQAPNEYRATSFLSISRHISNVQREAKPVVDIPWATIHGWYGLYWLFKRDPYVMVYQIIPYINGHDFIPPFLPLNNQWGLFFSWLNCLRNPQVLHPRQNAKVFLLQLENEWKPQSWEGMIGFL